MPPGNVLIFQEISEEAGILCWHRDVSNQESTLQTVITLNFVFESSNTVWTAVIFCGPGILKASVNAEYIGKLSTESSA